MNFYFVSMPLEGPVNQAQVVSHLKQKGCECIQTSDGLCVRCESSESELKSWLSEGELKGACTIRPASERGDLPKDVLAFMRGA